MEQLIRDRREQALNALDDLNAPPATRRVLQNVALTTTVRQS
ncbi:hypothetical protein ACFQ2B_36145 [Streptomyces stramineus]